MSKEKQILQLRTEGYSQRKIADILKVSRNTVAKVFQAAHQYSIDDDVLNDLNEQQLHLQLFPESIHLPIQTAPDYGYIHKELLKKGVTLKLLWQEYVDTCRQAGQPPFMYSQYCKKYQDYVNANKLTMHIKHKPGDKLMVDWAGTTMPLYNRTTGESCPVYLFVATLPFSMYVYAKACLTMKEADWINVHISMYEYFEGATRLLIPDNLKTGIISHRKHEDPIANLAYQELADHYNTALLPARVLSPQDKAAVEGSVKQVTTHVIAKLRNHKFFHLDDLNTAVLGAVEELNQSNFQKREGSRSSVYEEEELLFMQSLPAMEYEFAEWKLSTVQMNYHIALDNQNYSVPYEYVKKKVNVRYTKSLVEIFYQGMRICSHKRLYGRRGQYSTHTDHMPLNHQLYSEWDADRFQRWADALGTAAGETIKRILSSYRVVEQAYKGCLSLLKLADQYSAERLENACRVALDHLPNPRYKNIRLILEAGQDKKTADQTVPSKSHQYAYVRGAAYYGGDKHEQ